MQPSEPEVLTGAIGKRSKRRSLTSRSEHSTGYRVHLKWSGASYATYAVVRGTCQRIQLVRKKSDKTFQAVRHRVARNLARIRAEQGLTFEMLADRSGLHWRHVQKIEAGDMNITLQTISRLADGLSIDVEALFAQKGKSADGR